MAHARYIKGRRNKSVPASANEGKVVEGYKETRTRAVDIVGADCSPAGTKGAGTGSHRLWTAKSMCANFSDKAALVAKIVA